MNNVFRHDITRVFKRGFERVIHEQVLEKIILVNYRFFYLLSLHAKGKTLIVHTDQLLKKKKTKKKIQ